MLNQRLAGTTVRRPRSLRTHVYHRSYAHYPSLIVHRPFHANHSRHEQSDPSSSKSQSHLEPTNQNQNQHQHPIPVPNTRNQQHENQHQNQYRSRRLPKIDPAFWLLGFMPIFTFGLGTWQVQRLKWKVDLIDESVARLGREPVRVRGGDDLSSIPEFQRVQLEGTWDNAHSILIGPRVRDGTQGFHLITPLHLPSGERILVDRGFVSDKFGDITSWRNNPLLSATQAQGRAGNRESEKISLLCMIRRCDDSGLGTSSKGAGRRNFFTPDNKPEKEEWYWMDIDEIAKYVGNEDSGIVKSVFVEEIYEGHSGVAQVRIANGIPVGRTPTVDLRNQHLNYALTWYSLSAFTTFMFYNVMKRRARAPAMRMPRK